MRNWTSIQFIVGYIIPLVYLIREEESVLSVRELKQISRQDYIVYGTTLSGEAYRPENYVFWKVIHKITIGATEL